MLVVITGIQGYSQDIVNFSKYKNFNLYRQFWGVANSENITALLDSVITEFYSHLDNSKIRTSPVMVLNAISKDPLQNYPEIIDLEGFTLIYLSTRDLRWAQYSYQFSHELCHFIIGRRYDSNDRFGWLEETLCKLASLYTLKKMSVTWQTNPPYLNWKDYADELNNYANDIIFSSDNNIGMPLFRWLENNLQFLFYSRYLRTGNQIIAVQLLPIFTRTPDLWKIIQVMKNIVIVDNMSLEQYLIEWKKLIPPVLYSGFDSMAELLTGRRL